MLSDQIVDFFVSQNVVIVSTLDHEGRVHCSVKGIVEINPSGKILIIDLFNGKTLHNLRKNSQISLTAIDEENFTGYVLQGEAKIIDQLGGHQKHVEKWQSLIVQRISDRIISAIQQGRRSKSVDEAALPESPKHIIEITIDKVINLAPYEKLKREIDKEIASEQQ